LLLVGVYWAVVGVTSFSDIPTFYRFLVQAGTLLVMIPAFLLWWTFFNRRTPWPDRLLVLGAAVAAPVVGFLLADRSLGPITLFNGLPTMFTVWAAWLVLARGASRSAFRNGLVVVLLLSMAVFAAFRMEGLKGEGQADLHWRWSPTPDKAFLARAAGTALPASRPTTRAADAGPLVLRAGDWPGFRGPNRDGVVRGAGVSADWQKAPPKLLWRTPVGPAWSSVAVVDGRVFTQEQRGEREAVVCRDAAGGAEVWSHEEPGRFSESLSSVGPRATPTFDAGRIYAQGATGTLVCLDAATGRKVWSRDVLKDSDAKLPDWGVAGSPLVTRGVVVTFAAGQAKKGLLGYRADTGEVAWAVDGGLSSYSSPHPAKLFGRDQVLFVANDALHAVDPDTGATLWTYGPARNEPRSLQPAVLEGERVLVHMGMEVPTDLVSLESKGGTFAAANVWTSRNLKPSFNDFVVHEGHVYGFDGAMFTCVELAGGKRRWKQGRYGTGQVVLLAEAGVLLVVSDQGELIGVEAKPDALHEVGRFQAVNGKTWNHPAVAQGRLYVRSAQEMACYDLGGGATQ
jgi:outer membrane protein assembly factor BamB